MLLVNRLQTLVQEALVEGLVEVPLVLAESQLAVRLAVLPHFETVVLKWLLHLCRVLARRAPRIEPCAGLVPVDILAVRLLLVALTVDLDDVDADHGRLDPVSLGDWSAGVIGLVRGASLHATRVIFSFFRSDCLLRVLVGLVS